jgi:hypothetical protein
MIGERAAHGAREREAAEAAGRDAEARTAEWLAARYRCICEEPLPERLYLAHWSCRLCRLLIVPVSRAEEGAQ